MRLIATRRFAYPANKYVDEGELFEAKEVYGKVLLAVGFAIPAPEPTKEDKPKRQRYMTRRLQADDDTGFALSAEDK